jgi:hypothetical protein
MLRHLCVVDDSNQIKTKKREEMENDLIFYHSFVAEKK